MIDELKCKNCGAKSLEGQGGILICSYCGSKFTLHQDHPQKTSTSGTWVGVSGSFIEEDYIGASASYHSGIMVMVSPFS